MSLNELIHRFAPASPEERLKILEAMAACLPAPDFLWLPVVTAALASGDPALRLAALPLLAHAPAHWDTLLVTGLTTAEPEFQCAAIAVLARLAEDAPDHREAFGAVGALPGWLPEAQAAWRAAWRELGGAEAPTDDALVASALESLRGRLEAVEAERDALQTERDDAERALDAAKNAASEREAELSGALARSEADHADLRQEADTLESRVTIFQELAQKHERTAEGLRRKERRALTACGVAVALVVLGVPGGWALGSRSAILAEEPIKDVQAPIAAAVEPERPFREALLEAQADGYGEAMAALAGRAAELEKEGHLTPAATAWQCYAGLAKTPAETKHGAERAKALIAKAHEAKAPKVAARPAPARKVPPAPRLVKAPRPVSKAIAPKPPKPKAPPAPAAIEEAIPANVRAKF